MVIIIGRALSQMACIFNSFNNRLRHTPFLSAFCG